ncbi:hypothetical protein AAVH_38864 [Aphelenchoides avenae]|nr:hypothetical protein AAVH_38864 [Aphelenchus avenae]
MRYVDQDHYVQVGIVTHYAKDQKLALATRVMLFKEGILKLQESKSLSFVGRIIADEAH